MATAPGGLEVERDRVEQLREVLGIADERLVSRGASRVQRHEPAPPLGAGHIVMTDPEGNEFCLD